MASSIGKAAVVTALFRDAAATERAYRVALERDYKPEDISLVMSEETRLQKFQAGQVTTELADKAADSTEKQTMDATELGGPAGATAATLAPALVAVGAVTLIPGLILAGPIAVALAAAGAVGITGGLIGALTNWGIPRKRVEEYAGQISEGGILIGVKPSSEEDALHLQQAWQAAGGTLVHS